MLRLISATQFMRLLLAEGLAIDSTFQKIDFTKVSENFGIRREHRPSAVALRWEHLAG